MAGGKPGGKGSPAELGGAGEVVKRLCVEGRWLAEAESGRRVLLRGVNRSGMEYRAEGCGGITREEIGFLCGACGCSVVRIPFNQEWVLERPGYVEQIEQVAGWAAECGAYLLLDLQWLDARHERGAGNRVPCLPVPETLGMWAGLAERFRHNPAVLFDVFNEPHSRLEGDEFAFVRPSGELFEEQELVTGAMWREWALALVDAVRSGHPEAVVFVSGVDWGYDLRGFPLERENVVYSTHVYRARGMDWEECFGGLAREHCVFAGEWGGEAQDLAWGTRLADYFEELEMGWTAWSWTDHPRLWTGAGPTPFGKLVLDRLADAGKSS
jgi:hypothetical protein